MVLFTLVNSRQLLSCLTFFESIIHHTQIVLNFHPIGWKRFDFPLYASLIYWGHVLIDREVHK